MRVKITTSRPVPATLRDLVSRMVRGQGSVIPVQRQQIPYWQERGWTRKGNTYTGSYRTRYGAFFGQIAQHSGNDIEFLLYQPSAEIQQHSHWVCFQHQGKDWYLVHMGRRPADVSSGILAIERLISESFEQ
jgi:hypothetical protein